MFPLKYEGLTQLEKNQKKKWKLRMEVSVNLCILGESWLSLTPEPSIVSMEPGREGTSCHEEFRSGRVVAVGVNSIGEEINVRKVIPPGFIMILWGKKKETLLALARGAEKVKKGQGCFLGPLKGEGPVIYHWIPGDWCSLTWGPIFPNDIREEPSRMKKCYTSLRSSQDCWNQCFNNSLAVSGGGSFSFWLLSPAGYPGSTGVSSGPQFSHGCADTKTKITGQCLYLPLTSEKL